MPFSVGRGQGRGAMLWGWNAGAWALSGLCLQPGLLWPTAYLIRATEHDSVQLVAAVRVRLGIMHV
jgi:hypothetical protein